MRFRFDRFPSSQFYDDKIVNSISVAAPEYGGPTILHGETYSFVQVLGKEQQMKNQKRKLLDIGRMALQYMQMEHVRNGPKQRTKIIIVN